MCSFHIKSICYLLVSYNGIHLRLCMVAYNQFDSSNVFTPKMVINKIYTKHQLIYIKLNPRYPAFKVIHLFMWTHWTLFKICHRAVVILFINYSIKQQSNQKLLIQIHTTLMKHALFNYIHTHTNRRPIFE